MVSAAPSVPAALRLSAKYAAFVGSSHSGSSQLLTLKGGGGHVVNDGRRTRNRQSSMASALSPRRGRFICTHGWWGASARRTAFGCWLKFRTGGKRSWFASFRKR